MTDEKKNIKEVVVDRNLCIAAGSCIVAAGGVFELDSESKAVMKLKGGEKNSGPADRDSLEDGGVTDETLLAAAQSCPTLAILLKDKDGNQVYP